jgi:F-box protein 9
MAKPSNVDLEELARFREEWKREVEAKRNPPLDRLAAPSRPQPQPSAEYDISGASSSGNATPSNETSTISSIPPVLTTSGYFNASTVPSAVRHALALYTRAVQHEQSGQLDTGAYFI